MKLILKGGIFIIVQGIRSLSLEHKLLNTSTAKRIKVKLTEINVLDPELAKRINDGI